MVFDDILADPSAPAIGSGLPVIGYLANTAPVEMIRAAGAFAQQVTGSPEDDTPDALKIMEDFSDGWALSVFQQLLDGRLGHLDGLVIPRTSEANLQLYYHIQEVIRQMPDVPMPETILFDILQTPFATTAKYNAGRMAALRDRLSKLTGRAIGDDDLSATIAEANEVRASLCRLNDWRIAGEIRASEMWRAVRASTVMAPADFLTLAAGLDGGDSREVWPRLLLTGSPHDCDGFHRVIEDCGASVTADDHMAGDWWFLDPVGAGDPIAALVEKYHLAAPSPRSYPPEVCDARVLAAAERGRVDGAVFFFDHRDDCLGFDYPTQAELLAKAGIPAIRMDGQAYRVPDRSAQAAQVEALLAKVAAREVMA